MTAGYTDASAVGTVSRITVTLTYTGNDGNADVENMNAFLMDNAGSFVSTYYTPISSSNG